MLDNECLKDFYMSCGSKLPYADFETMYCRYEERSKFNTLIRVLSTLNDINHKVRKFIAIKLEELFMEYSLLNETNISMLFVRQEFDTYLFKPRDGTGKYRSVRITCAFKSDTVVFSYRDHADEYMDVCYKLIKGQMVEVQNV